MVIEADGSGQIKSLEFLLEQDLIIDVFAIMKASGNGHLHVLNWLKENGLDDNMWTTANPVTEKGHLDILIWLYDNYEALPREYGIADAKKRSHQHVVDWATKKGVFPLQQ